MNTVQFFLLKTPVPVRPGLGYAKSMSSLFPPPPPNTESLLPVRPSAEARRLLALRRSAGKSSLSTPGPSPDQVDELLRIAARVPDHRKLEPWRFIVFEGEARAAFGARIAELQNDEAAKDEDRGRLMRAPVVIAVISSPDTAHKTPVWEQELSCGAVCYNLLLAANAAGWAGCWLTEWIAFDAGVDELLSLGPDECVAGFIYLGTATANPPERPRPDIAVKITRWAG